VWVVSELYYPEETSTGYFLSRIAESLTGDYDVRAVCAQPTYSGRGTRAPWREHHAGVDIRRCRATTLNKDVLPFRLANLITISASIAWHLARHVGRGDVVLVTTNPPALSMLAALVCRLRGAASVLLIHDVYPDSLVAAGMLAPGGVAARAMASLTTMLYRRVSRVCVIGRDMERLVRRKTGEPAGGRIVVIPNWPEPGLAEERREGNTLLAALGLEHKFVLQYAGNIGRVHGIDLLVAAARELRSLAPDVHFLFIGSGARKRWLEEAIARDGLTNITLLPPHPRSDQPLFLPACDVAVTAFVPGMAGVGVPSRLYNILAVGRPIIGAVDDESELALVVREEQIGWTVPAGDVAGFVAAVLAALADGERLRAMGHRARVAAVTKYSMGHAMSAYHALIDAARADAV
jgi:glycosyltransferase involved in cell wall biosynthesis